ncbi:MAG: AAA family ATPase [Prevotellaceae bacterium]|jgi:shikimate kinase|nr:AAA family ATPase [Prevotellaceae bacterium]
MNKKRKKHIILVGMPGSGKSSLGLILSKLMSLPFIDTDYYILTKEQMSINDIFAEHGEAYFRKLEQQMLLEIVKNEPSIISAGGGMPCFYDNMNVMNRYAVTIYLKLAPEQLFKHLKNNKERPLVKDETPEELMNYINTSLEQRKPYYEKADIIMQAHGETPTQFAVNLRKIIATKYPFI